MTAEHTSIGIDCRGGLFYVARLDSGVGRHEVKALLRLEKQHLGDHELLQGGQTILSLADQNVMVKRLRLDTDDDLQVRFELAQTLPDQPADYFFDTVASGLEGQIIGMAVRRDRLAEYTNVLLGESAGLFPDVRFKMRAAALASGYLNFCRRTGGDLICLADFTPASISLAFTYQGMVVDVCHQPLVKFDPTSDGSTAKMAVEMKTLVNFRCAALFSEGITTPLSSLIVSGDTVTDSLIENIRRMFTIDISRPAINAGFISSQADLSQVPLENYIVALGLAAN